MVGMPSCRIDRAILPPAPSWGDVGECEATIDLHPWLHCMACGSRLYHGVTFTGAPIFVCRFPSCSRILDRRRVA